MELIDNVNRLLGNELKSDLMKGSKLQIAASCFSMYAFVALKKELSNIDSLKFIFTEPTFTPEIATDKIKKEHREFHIPKTHRERSLYGSDFEIQLKNELTQKAVARECAEWIRSKVKFKSNTSTASMQQFMTTQDRDQQNSVFAPISGFTAVDLGYQKGNAVSSLSHKFDQAPFTQQYLSLFEQMWNDETKLADVTEEVIRHIDSVYQENSPEKIYFVILYNIFNEFLEEINEDVLANDRTGYQETVIWNTLFNYQKDAATGIINKLEMYNGCILADSVGLGKTFTALAVMKYYELRNKSVLLLCPKKLAENWLTYNRNVTTNILVNDRFNYDVLCHTDLSRTRGESFGMPLNQINWGNYDLVVIDESHNFRNDNAVKERETRYQKLMNQVIRSGVKTKVLMLSATPVNNRFSDLRNQLALAYEGQSENLTKNLKTNRTVEDIFKRAQKTFNKWADLPPDDRTPKAILDSLDIDFFELLDSVTIARSRKHIQAFYDTSDIGKFPDRLPPKSYHCPLTTLASVPPTNEIFSQLRLLKMCVYAPISYVLPSRLKKYEEMYDTEVSGGRGKLRQQDREKALVALMTTNLLKRLESSVYAFRKTLNALKTNHEAVLAKIAEFNENGGITEIDDLEAAMGLIDSDDDDSFQDAEVGGKVKIQLHDMDLLSWEQDLRADLTLIESLFIEMQAITPEHDAKLQHLQVHTAAKQAKPINAGNKKIIIFTAFADTAQYLYEQLAPTLWANHQIHTAMITGSSNLPKSTLNTGKRAYDVQETLTLFSPVSKSKAAVLPEEHNEIDILIATDCISEGQNLQDCDYLINYDIHWNPVRIVQRFGRIDRIGSPNDVIQLVNYWPDITLDEYINLKERVESRMVIVDAAGVAGDNILLEKQNELAYRKDQLKRLQEETLDLEDLKTGVSITDLGLNDFRMDLMAYVEKYGEPKNVANGLHAVVPDKKDIGLEPGVIFVLKNTNSCINIDQKNRLHPYYIIYVTKHGDVIANHTEVKRLLDIIRTSCKGQVEPVESVCRIFNSHTDDGRKMDAYSDLLSQAIRSMVEVKEESDIDSLFSCGRTSALTNVINGLDDFELIAFLVVEGAS